MEQLKTHTKNRRTFGHGRVLRTHVRKCPFDAVSAKCGHERTFTDI